MVTDKINPPIVVATELFQLVSDPEAFQRFKTQNKAHKEVISKFSNMAQFDIREIINNLFEKFRHINRYFLGTKWAQTYKNEIGLQKAIRKNLLILFDKLSGHLPDNAFTNIIDDLSVFGDMYNDPAMTDLIFEFFAKLKEQKAFKFCKTHILSSIDYDRHKTHIFHNKLNRLTELTPFLDETFDFILSLMPKIFENLPNSELNNFMNHFRGYFYNLIRRDPSMAARLFPVLVQTDGYPHLAIFQTIIRAGSLPEAETNIFACLIDLLTSNETSYHSKYSALQIIKKLSQEEGKADRGKIISIILKKAKDLSGLEKEALDELFASLFQILGHSSQQWREAVDIISSKLVFDIDLAGQRTYVEGKLKEYELTVVEESYDRFMKSCERDGTPALETLRKVYEGVINYLVNKLNGKMGSDFFTKLHLLEKKGLFKTTQKISEPLNADPHKIKHHLELHYAYNLYGLLSHYGAHLVPIDELQFSLYVQTISWLYFLFKRYERLK